MNNLPKEMDERIAKEAVEEAKKRCLRTQSFRYGYEDGYYDGGTAEATRAMEREKGLVEALEGIVKWEFATDARKFNGDHKEVLKQVISLANQALTNYAGEEEKEVSNG